MIKINMYFLSALFFLIIGIMILAYGIGLIITKIDVALIIGFGIVVLVIAFCFYRQGKSQQKKEVEKQWEELDNERNSN